VTNRRFPPPWTAEYHNDACFVLPAKMTPRRAGPRRWLSIVVESNLRMQTDA